MQIQSFARIPLDISDFPTRHNYGLALLQIHFERILAGWVDELGVPIAREREVTGFAQDDTGVDVELSDGQSLRAEYLVGCDGGRSVIRKAAGIEFAGWDPTTSWIIAEVEMKQQPEFGLRDGWWHRPGGGHRASRGRAQGTRGRTRERADAAGSPRGAHRRRRDRLRRAQPDLHLPLHRHDPAGGVLPQGTGAARGRRRARASPARRAGPQHRCAGRREPRMEAGPGGQRDITRRACSTRTTPSGTRSVPACSATRWRRWRSAAPTTRTAALHDTMTELLSMDEPRKRIAGMLSGLDIHYDLGDGHPLLGRRMPDLDVHTADGPTRVFTLLHDARPVLLNLGEPGGFDIALPDRVRLVDAKHSGVWELPVIGEVARLRPC